MNTKVMLSGLLVAVGFVSAEAMAYRKYFEQFSEHYQANQISTQLLTSEQACGVCHVRASGGGQRTPYGEDFKKVALGEGKGFPGIEFLDSDQDGFLNLEEIFLQTAPGKSEEAPQGRIELALENSSTLLVRPSMACSQLNLKAFGFSFENNAGEFVLSNVVGETRLQISGEAGAILARCDSEKLAGSLLR
jgi:hypothetical protein